MSIVKYICFSPKSSSKVKISNSERPLDKAIEISTFEYYCQRICPYVLLICILVFSVLLAFAFVKYGADLFSTPQNRWEHLEQAIYSNII